MGPSDWVALAVGAPTALTVVWGVARALPRRLRSIEDRVVTVEAEHRNNGGSTLRDSIDRIEASGNRVEQTLNSHMVDEARRSGAMEAKLELLLER